LFILSVESQFQMDSCSSFTPGRWNPNQCCDYFQSREKHLITQKTTPAEEIVMPSTVVHPSETVAQSEKLSNLSPTTGTNSSKSVSNNSHNNMTTLSSAIQSNASSTDLHILIQQNLQQFMASSTTFSSIQSEPSSTDKDTFTQQSTTGSNAYNGIPLDKSATNQSVSSQQIKQPLVPSSTILDTQIQISANRASRELEPCKHGIKCYRTNPAHFEQYSHPPGFKNYPTLNSYSDRKSVRKQTPCEYGTKCYRKNPDHFERFSHPPKSPEPPEINPQCGNQQHDINSEIVSELKVELEVQQQIAQIHLELVEKQFLDSIEGLKKKHEYYEQEIEKLRSETIKMASYHQQLEKALGEELNNRDRREIEKQRILAVRRDTPSYWGTNAFAEPYREINIRQESPEFSIINALLNGTIEGHKNKYGTIYRKDPTEFIITKITRIHNNNLWHEYCFKKVNKTNTCPIRNPFKYIS
jgi:hypothetical protein